VIYLLLKVVRAATGAQVWWHELGHLIDGHLTVDLVEHVRWGIVVDVVGVVSQVVPREGLEEGEQRGDVSPRGAREDGAPWRFTDDEAL
jgi:hypothetical protein